MQIQITITDSDLKDPSISEPIKQLIGRSNVKSVQITNDNSSETQCSTEIPKKISSPKKSVKKESEPKDPTNKRKGRSPTLVNGETRTDQACRLYHELISEPNQTKSKKEILQSVASKMECAFNSITTYVYKYYNVWLGKQQKDKSNPISPTEKTEKEIKPEVKSPTIEENKPTIETKDPPKESIETKNPSKIKVNNDELENFMLNKNNSEHKEPVETKNQQLTINETICLLHYNKIVNAKIGKITGMEADEVQSIISKNYIEWLRTTQPDKIDDSCTNEVIDKVCKLYQTNTDRIKIMLAIGFFHIGLVDDMIGDYYVDWEINHPISTTE